MSARRKRNSMFLRMLFRAAVLRKGRALAALLALVVAATAATAMLNLVVDVQAKLRKEFRKFGANVIAQPPEGHSFSAEDLSSINQAVASRGVAVPFAYAVAHTQTGQPIVVAGTDFSGVRALNPWWSVSSWPTAPGQALAGVRTVEALNVSAGSFLLNYQGRILRLSLAGDVETGSGEDSRVYVSLADLHSWTGLESVVVEIAALGSPKDVISLIEQLRRAVPSADIRPVRQVTEGEANVLGKTHSTLIASTAFIVVTASLCVLATLMGWVFDRRRDFAIMKALGASDRLIAMFVAGEATLMGSIGAVLGFAAGAGVAAWVGRANFHAPVVPRLSLFPPVLIGCLIITLLASIVPVRLLGRIQPAMILKGE
jgi:putative ABC transport system permease protein